MAQNFFQKDFCVPLFSGAVLKGMRSVKAVMYSKKPYVLARSYTNSSKLYWSSLGGDEKWSSWSRIGGGSASLMTDASVVYNSFSKVITSIFHQLLIEIISIIAGRAEH